MSNCEPERQSVQAGLDALAGLGTAMLESGYPTEAALHEMAQARPHLGVESATIVAMGRVVIVQSPGPDGISMSKVAEASTLDTFNCDQMKRVKQAGRSLGQDGKPIRTACSQLASAVTESPPFPWWWAPAGGMLLAFCICLQIGGTVLASALAGGVLLVVYLTGRGLGARQVPKFFAVAVQAAVAGALGGLIHLGGGMPVPQTAALLATAWVLILPLPQMISMSIDMVNSDSLTAWARGLGVVLITSGVSLGAFLVLVLSWQLDIDQASDPELPTLPVWLGITFAVAGAVGNALYNVGGRDLLVPAAALGLFTASVNQGLIHLLDIPPGWAAPIAAVPLGFVAAAAARRLQLPITALALVGITGALLPGLTVAEGLILSVYEQSAATDFGQAIAICVGLGVGASLGVYLWTLSAGQSWLPSPD
jgi:uncharacterized membrane protein YjjP (DUF1212 family)